MKGLNLDTLKRIVEDIHSDMNIFVDIEKSKDYDTYDIIYKNLEYYVKTNSIKENKSVLAYFNTDTYEAINKYKEDYGNFEPRDKEHFYALLAFHLIHTYFMKYHYKALNDNYNEIKKKNDLKI